METPSQQTQQQILAHAPIAIVITDDSGLILWCNDTLSQWLGRTPGSCVGRNETALLHCQGQAGRDSGIPAHNGPHLLGQSDDGGKRWVLRQPTPLADGQQAIFYLDISEEETLRKERTQMAQQLEQHNTVDAISGLLNGQAINKGLEPLVSRSRRYQNPLSVVTMAIINLHDVSDSAGQVAADRLIVGVSQLLRDQMRWADLVGRLDSGQFIFVLPETDRDAAVALANKIATQLTDLSITIDDSHRVTPQACFGVTAWAKGDDSRLLLQRSHEAAQAATQRGAFSVEAA